MDELGGILLIIALIIGACVFALAGIYTALAFLSVIILGVIDNIFGGFARSGNPVLMWALWGGILGASIGFWTVAPIYGVRSARPWIVSAPLLMALLLAIYRLLTLGSTSR